MLLFQRNFRLRQAKSFRHVYQAPTKIFAGKFVFCFRKNTLGYPRLGISVPKRSVPSSVRRNRIKRLHRECFRARQNALGDIDIVVGVRKNISMVPRDELYQHVKRQWDYFLSQYGNCS